MTITTKTSGVSLDFILYTINTSDFPLNFIFIFAMVKMSEFQAHTW